MSARARSDLDTAAILRAYSAGESATSIARRCKCSVWAVISRIDKAGVRIRSAKEQNARWLGDGSTPANPTRVKAILEGLMLGDASIDKRDGVLRVEQSTDTVEWLYMLQLQLQAAGCESSIADVAPRVRQIDERKIRSKGGKVLYTRSYSEFKAERDRWYPRRGVKIVPRDLVLTPISMAQWWSGDGTYDARGNVRFCTDGFTIKDVEFLIERVAIDFGVSARLERTGRGDPSLAISSIEDAFKLARIALPYMPFCCLYKFKYLRHSRVQPALEIWE